LFLGDESRSALTATDRFTVSQDQRHTVRARVNYAVTPKSWVALAASYGSGLPVEFSGDHDEAVAQYGQRIVNRVDLEAGRVRPSLAFDASVGVVLAKTARRTLRVQADVRNLTDRLNVINFAGLFSGTALGVPRSVGIRLQVEF
jgi:outer membrane receptor for Fe3+-dicitrate